MIATATRTTTVDCISSLRVGQVTLRNSASGPNQHHSTTISNVARRTTGARDRLYAPLTELGREQTITVRTTQTSAHLIAVLSSVVFTLTASV